MALDPIEAALRGQREVVIDASLAADALIGEPARHALAVRFFTHCDTLGVRLTVPESFPSEADTAMFQGVARGRIAAALLPALLAALDTLVVTVAREKSEAHAVRVRAREIAAMLNQPGVYDATYAALAERRGCEFWTADKRFANAANQTRRAPDGTSAPGFPFVRFVGKYK